MPTVGGLQASAGQWRPLFWGVAGIAALALLTFEDDPPQDESRPVGHRRRRAGRRRLRGRLLRRLAAAERRPRAVLARSLDRRVVMLAALLVHQYRARHPLMLVRQLATTFPAFGILIAMAASASAFGLTELVLTTLQKSTPTAIALQFLPEFGAAVLTAVLFAFLFRTGFTPVLAIGGLAVVAVAAALLTGLASGGSTLVAASSGLIGLGVGASVSPAPFIRTWKPGRTASPPGNPARFSAACAARRTETRAGNVRDGIKAQRRFGGAKWTCSARLRRELDVSLPFPPDAGADRGRDRAPHQYKYRSTT
jgi:MFS family permease